MSTEKQNQESRAEKNKEKSRLKKKQWIIIASACAAAAAIAGIAFAVSGNSGNSEVYEDLKEEAIPAAATPAPTPEPTHEPFVPYVDPGLVPADKEIDFDLLFERNPDVIGWITVEGTDIDYPVLQSRDNEDYLLNDIDGEENAAGAIFMDMENRTNFGDRNTVIYGHNMKNGTMFAGLHEFEDGDFFEENREIKLYTPEGMRVYEIIAAYRTDNLNLLDGKDYTDDKFWNEYVDSVLSNRDMSANIAEAEVGADDRILTLSTCVRGEDEQRYLVQGVLKLNETDEQEQ